MATPLEAIKAVAEQNLGFYAFCFADEIAVSDVQEVAEWAQSNNRMFMTVVSDVDEAVTLGNSLKTTDIHHYNITYHQEYSAVGAIAGMALDQRYDKADGVKTLHLKSLRGLPASDITQSKAYELNEAKVNYYSNYGNADNNLPVFTNGYAGAGKYFDFVMGIDWLRNAIETNVFNGQRTRRSTPQNNKGMMMVKSDIINAMDSAVTAGLVGAGQWNGESIGEVETFDYLPNGYYIYNEPIITQNQEDREQRTAPPFTVLAKGAGALHGIDITLIPQA